MITIEIDINDEEAMALAQFLKRLGWDEIRINAKNDEDASLMRHSLNKLQDAMDRAGYNPR